MLGKLYILYPTLSYLSQTKWGDEKLNSETETVECVTIEARVPKAFIDHIQKQKWFIKGYEDLDDFISDAVRRLKMHYERG